MVTVDNWAGYGSPKHAVVIYDQKGKVTADLTYAQVMRGLPPCTECGSMDGPFLTLAAFSARPPTLPGPAQLLSRLSAFLLPLYPALALYGLAVRVGEYGLTEERLLGLVATVWLLVTALGLALTRRAPAFAGLSP